MLVQAMLPLLVAAEIHLASQGELPSVHSAAQHHQQHQPSGKAHHHATPHGCPICQAAAVGLGFTLSAAPAAPLPRFFLIATVQAATSSRLNAVVAFFYRARAPPPSSN